MKIVTKTRIGKYLCIIELLLLIITGSYFLYVFFNDYNNSERIVRTLIYFIVINFLFICIPLALLLNIKRNIRLSKRKGRLAKGNYKKEDLKMSKENMRTFKQSRGKKK